MSNHFRDSNMRPASPIIFKSGAPISVVCVAATYTGVTYANNGGKVQLLSAGVHGLTTSPAVGASVYVSWASGKGVSGLYTVLSVDSTLAFTINADYAAGLGTPTVARTSTYINFETITIPPLSKDSSVKVSAAYSIPAPTTNAKIFKFLHGGQNRIEGGSSSAILYSFRLDGVIKNIGVVNSQVVTRSTPPGGSSANAYETNAVDTSVSTVIAHQAWFAAANEVLKREYYIVEVFI